MKFKKEGKVYANMVVAVYDYCNGLKYCYGCKLYGKTGDCLAYAQLHPKEVARLLGYEVIEDKPDTGKGVIMNNERKMSILLNTIEQMACDAEDKGEIDFGLRLTVEDAYALCHAASHTDNTPDIREVVEENSEDVKRRLTRADILHAAEKCVCGQREQDYGTPEDNFETIAELWETYLRRACVDEAGGVYIDANDVAMMMALLKIARIAAGGGKADSWIDLAGYAACGAECEGVTE
jgi:hypothetical protein|nr:MAG TPA: hypothetical protein [Caudoviricetes sp.]